MNEMIERVARGIHNYRPRATKWEECAVLYQKELLLQAKAAIEAMREPTFKMMNEYWNEKRKDGHTLQNSCFDVNEWERMIDAALK